MREECKHFQSRTYQSGEVARFCVLDLAPEAPWRCPEACTRYEIRMADVGWVRGTLIEPATPLEPSSLEGVGDLLDQAEDIINAAGPGIVEEVERQRAKATSKRGSRSTTAYPAWWKRWRRRP